MKRKQKMPTSSTRMEYIQREFNDHPSLASLDDYEPPSSVRQSPTVDLPSTHSGFRSYNPRAASEILSDPDSESPWSPPAWRRPASGWFQPVDRLAKAQRRGSAWEGQHIKEEEDQDLSIPANVPLPASPEKTPGPNEENIGQEEDKHLQTKAGEKVPDLTSTMTTLAPPTDNRNNYIRFSVRADVQQRTEPIEAMVAFLRHQYRRITRSKSSLFTFFTFSILLAAMVKALFETHDQGPVPDLVKVAGLARSFEPIIHYSENGVAQVGELQETGVAVWDLGESVRYSNMTSASIIVRELDDLSESLKTLAIELTRFFANVDGDIDSILIVMEWAKRELHQVSGHMPGRLTVVYENMFTYIHRVGGSGASKMLTDFFGQTQNQVTKAALQRTFNEFLNVLEESINTELTYSTALFGLFEAIDRQFLNLQRTVIRETDSQEVGEATAGSELAELWRRRIGSNKARIAKFEKNKQLLASIKDKTVQNKLTLVDHNGKLLKLKANLEILRKRLVSPLVRSNDTSTLSVEEQIKGLDSTHSYLRLARETQKSKLMERLYGAGSRRIGVTIGEERHA